VTVTAPEWLSKRGGTLRLGSDGRTWFVDVGNALIYRLAPTPAEGKYSCPVTQTVNGRRLDKGGVFASPEDALRGGLEDLRQALGW
jgi:hypothetical protein